MEMDYKMKEQIILIGAGGHCKIMIESLERNKYEIYGILDEFAEKGTLVCGIPVIGTDQDAADIFRQGIHNAIISIVGDLKIRRQILTFYKSIGFHFPSVIHQTCCISDSAQLGEGVTLLANSCINSEAKIADYVTVNTGAIIEHEVIIDENSHIAPGAILLGASKVGRDTMIGAGSVILQQRVIGNHCIVGAGSVVLNNIDNGKTVYGNPAREK